MENPLTATDSRSGFELKITLFGKDGGYLFVITREDHLVQVGSGTGMFRISKAETQGILKRHIQLNSLGSG